MMKEWLLTADDTIDKEPGDGDMVIYLVKHPVIHKYQTYVGIIARELNDSQWIINGQIQYKLQVLFVLTLEGYLKQKRFCNTLAY